MTMFCVTFASFFQNCIKNDFSVKMKSLQNKFSLITFLLNPCLLDLEIFVLTLDVTLDNHITTKNGSSNPSTHTKKLAAIRI